MRTDICRRVLSLLRSPRPPRRDHRSIEAKPCFESLEARRLLSVSIAIDYTYDTNGFFDDADRRAALEMAAEDVANRLDDNLEAINPGGGDTWTATFLHPATGDPMSAENLSINEDEILIFAGGFDTGGLGFGGAGGYEVTGSSGWVDTVSTRGQTGVETDDDVAPWGGIVTFNTNANWHFGQTTEGLESDEFDFLSTAYHELFHLLGFSDNNPSYMSLVNTSDHTFTGANAVAAHDGAGPPPLEYDAIGGDFDADHWSDDLTDGGQETLMDPDLFTGERKLATELDWAVLDDIGWTLVNENPLARHSDFDGDGQADIVWRNNATGNNLVWLMDDTRHVNSIGLTAAPNTDWSLQGVGDFNGDDQPDMVWRNQVTGENQIWIMDGTQRDSVVGLSTIGNTSWRVGAVGDFNGDGQSDIFWRNGATGDNLIWEMDGTSVQNSHGIDSVPNLDWQVAGAGDFDLDGTDDVLWHNAATGGNLAWTIDNNARTGELGLPAVPNTSWTPGAVVDVNNDGNADILWRNRATGGNLAWLLGAGTNINQSVGLDAFVDQNMVMPTQAFVETDLVADYEFDGDEDIFWRNVSTGDHLVWEMDGLTFETETDLPALADTDWRLADSADMNNDGHADLLFRNLDTGETTLWLMRGDQIVSTLALPQVSNLDWRIAGLSDFTGDGQADLLWRNYNSGENLVWQMEGARRVNSFGLQTVANLDWVIADAADFDADGDADVLWRNGNTGENLIWQLTGNTIDDTIGLQTVANTAWQPVSGLDFDGDGDADIHWHNTLTGAGLVWVLDGMTVVSTEALPAMADPAWHPLGQVNLIF